MAFVDELKSRIDSTRKQWERASREAREAKERAGDLYGKLTALQRVYDAEKGTGKKTQPATAASPAVSIVAPNGLNKSEMVRELIRRNPGMRPPEIREALRVSGAETNDTYVYSVLLRAKKAGHIREEQGRYYIDVSDDMHAKVAS